MNLLIYTGKHFVKTSVKPIELEPRQAGPSHSSSLMLCQLSYRELDATNCLIPVCTDRLVIIRY